LAARSAFFGRSGKILPPAAVILNRRPLYLADISVRTPSARTLRYPLPVGRGRLGNLKNEEGEQQMFKNDSSHVLTVKELSDYLKVHPSTIYRQLKRGRLPAFKVGSDWRFNIESIDRWRLEQDAFKEL
jgi:excisionase family DNA binding protein